MFSGVLDLFHKLSPLMLRGKELEQAKCVRTDQSSCSGYDDA